MFANDDPPSEPRHGEAILVAALTALATTLCSKFAEKLIDRVWPAPKDENK